MIGKHVIVRADKAGVFFGILESKNGSEVKMTKVRKLYYWSGAAAVEQLALDGVSKPNDCKFTVVVEEMEISNYIQIIPCTEKSINSLSSIPEWKQ